MSQRIRHSKVKLFQVPTVTFKTGPRDIRHPTSNLVYFVSINATLKTSVASIFQPLWNIHCPNNMILEPRQNILALSPSTSWLPSQKKKIAHHPSSTAVSLTVIISLSLTFSNSLSLAPSPPSLSLSLPLSKCFYPNWLRHMWGSSVSLKVSLTLSIMAHFGTILAFLILAFQFAVMMRDACKEKTWRKQPSSSFVVGKWLHVLHQQGGMLIRGRVWNT